MIGNLWEDGAERRERLGKMEEYVSGWDVGGARVTPGGHLSYQRPPFRASRAHIIMYFCISLCLCGQYVGEPAAGPGMAELEGQRLRGASLHCSCAKAFPTCITVCLVFLTENQQTMSWEISLG